MREHIAVLLIWQSSVLVLTSNILPTSYIVIIYAQASHALGLITVTVVAYIYLMIYVMNLNFDFEILVSLITTALKSPT